MQSQPPNPSIDLVDVRILQFGLQYRVCVGFDLSNDTIVFWGRSCRQVIQHLIAPQLEVHNFPIKVEQLLVWPLAHSVVRVAHDVPQLLLHLGLASAVAWDHQSSHWVEGSQTRHTQSQERRNDSCGSPAVIETPLHEAQVPCIVRRAYALTVEHSPHNLPMSPMELVVVADLRRFVKTTTGPPVRSRFSQLQAVGSESVSCLVPTV